MDEPAPELGDLVGLWHLGQTCRCSEVDGRALLFFRSDPKQRGDPMSLAEILPHGYLHDVPGLKSKAIVQLRLDGRNAAIELLIALASLQILPFLWNLVDIDDSLRKGG